MNGRYDAVVIGAGVVGCSIALSFSRAGYRTLNVDALPAAGYGSTSHSSAIVRPYYSHVTSCAIAHEARGRWLNWADYLGANDTWDLARYRETGGLVLMTESEDPADNGALNAMSEVGVPFEILDADQVRRLYPNISLAAFGPPCRPDEERFGQPTQGRVAGGVYIPACGYVSDPQLAAQNLFQAARSSGAAFQFNCRVTDIETIGEQISGIRTDDGQTIESQIVINAAGPHSRFINDLAGITPTLPIGTRPERHEVAYVKMPEDHSAQQGFFVDLDSGVYQRQDGPDLLIGSADPACDKPDVVDPDDYNDQFTDQWTTQVYRAAQRFPDLQIESRARGTVGIYDVSDDWIPIYDKTDLPGYYLAIGTSGNQFKNAPIIGEILLRIVETERQGNDHDQAPASLHLPHVDRTVRLDFYSRLRDIQDTANVLA